MSNGFRVYPLPDTAELIDGLWDELAASAALDLVGKGRHGGVRTLVDAAGRVPLVRTTTCYRTPARPFSAAHLALAQQVQERAALPLGFNNALFESYSSAYHKMGSHSDQAQDLAEGSAIAVFSCYQHPERTSSFRELVVEAKAPGQVAFTIPLLHAQAVVFTVDTNRLFRHKIALPASARQLDNQWLGLTFRTSKTLLQFHDAPHFVDGVPLTLADAEQRAELLRLRGRENRETDFTYPRLRYTLSEGDLLPPVPR